MKPGSLIERAWRFAKIGTRIPIGPLMLHLRVARTVRVSRDVRPDSMLSRSRVRRTEATLPGDSKPSTASGAEHAILPPVAPGVALIVGTGPGLGSALARRFSTAGMAVAVVARNTLKLDHLLSDLHTLGGTAFRYGCDASDERGVKAMLNRVVEDLGVPDLVVYNVEHFIPGTILNIETCAFEECWRAMALGGFIIGRETARLMVPRGSGTIIYTGATGALRGRPEYLNMAVGKFGVRALAQSMARDLAPKGIHVAHVILDGGILPPDATDEATERFSRMHSDHIAEIYYQLHLQHRSTWTHEMDVRPWTEKF
jgi:NAD(P)-dependent dehydrogenase (short-subunit alcohol dehydrogenase family)